MVRIDAFEEADVTELCRHLIGLWETRTEITPGQRRQALSMPKFVVVHGLTAHTYRLGSHVLDMFTAGLTLESVPLVRLAYESALTAHWLAQNVDGAEAFVNKDLMSRKAAADTFRRSRSSVLREGAADLLDEGMALHETTSQQQARHFEQLCRDLEEAGEDAYAYYRVMSWYSHPSSHVADRYIDFNFDTGTIVSLRHKPNVEQADMWRFFLACSLIWAARAVDFIDVDRSHRNELRRAAKSLGVPDALHLSAAARSRTAKATKARPRS